MQCGESNANALKFIDLIDGFFVLFAKPFIFCIYESYLYCLLPCPFSVYVRRNCVANVFEKYLCKTFFFNELLKQIHFLKKFNRLVKQIKKAGKKIYFKYVSLFGLFSGSQMINLFENTSIHIASKTTKSDSL